LVFLSCKEAKTDKPPFFLGGRRLIGLRFFEKLDFVLAKRVMAGIVFINALRFILSSFFYIDKNFLFSHLQFSLNFIKFPSPELLHQQ